jgi:hypothetical protein
MAYAPNLLANFACKAANDPALTLMDLILLVSIPKNFMASIISAAITILLGVFCVNCMVQSNGKINYKTIILYKYFAILL